MENSSSIALTRSGRVKESSKPLSKSDSSGSSGSGCWAIFWTTPRRRSRMASGMQLKDSRVSPVTPGQVIPANQQQVEEWTHAVHQTYLGSLDVIPADWTFNRPESPPARYVEVFDIETEALQLLPAEHHSRRIAMVQFETALRV